ncbi:MAG: succinate dehydrogenase/fumarate reductase iron-sulfur subunit [Thermoplasmata archaeon]
MTLLKVLRYDPQRDDEPHYLEYDVEVVKGLTVLDALLRIKDEVDGSLAVRYSCKSAICGSCAMTVNHRNRLACKTQVSSLGRVVRVEPLSGYSIIKDLVVDMEPFWEQIERILPYFITKSPEPERERVQTPKERKLIDETTWCIFCGACSSSCPVMWTDERYIGPAAFVKAWRFVADSRDEGADERLDRISSEFGVWRCHTIFRCVDSCPKDINPTVAIESLRKALVRRSFKRLFLPKKRLRKG